VHEVAPQTGISVSSNPQDFPQGHLLPIEWTMPTWASEVGHHLHAQDLLNLIWKSVLNSRGDVEVFACVS